MSIAARVEFLQCKIFGKMFFQKVNLRRETSENAFFLPKNRGEKAEKQERTQPQLSNSQRLIKNEVFF